MLSQENGKLKAEVTDQWAGAQKYADVAVGDSIYYELLIDKATTAKLVLLIMEHDAGYTKLKTTVIDTDADGFLSGTYIVSQGSRLRLKVAKDDGGDLGITTHYYLDDVKMIKKDIAIREESNYYPFGLKHKGYNSVVTGTHHPYGFGGKEEQQELDLNWLDFSARNYNAALGRWMNVDPMAEVMFDQSPYVYALNSPLFFIDPDGALPWPVHIRSFISSKSTGGGLFGGDGRGASTQSSPDARSRVETTFTVDPAKGTVTNPISRSDNTLFYGIPSGSPTTPSIPPIIETPKPESSITNVSSSENSLSLDFEHSAKDPVTPSLITPDLDVQASLNITEDLEAGVLNITGEFTGDAFPSTEAFITDQSGKTNLLLGAHKEQGGLGKLFGENKRPTFSVNMQVNIDSKGNFTGVTQGDKTYTVAEWNKHVQNTFNNQ